MIGTLLRHLRSNPTGLTPAVTRDDTPVVELRCPRYDHVVATEKTRPKWTEENRAAYECSRCHRLHVFRWNSRPRPTHVEDVRG